MNVYALLREVPGPRPLCRVPGNYSKPRIWNSFEIQTTEKIMGPRKDQNPTSLELTGFRRRFYASNTNVANLRYVKGSKYRGMSRLPAPLYNR